MKRKYFWGLCTTIILIGVFVSLNFKADGLIYANDSCLAFTMSSLGCDTAGSGFPPFPESKPRLNPDFSIGYLVADGGFYFLLGKSDFSRFLSKVEIAENKGADFEGMRQDLKNAIQNMESAIDVYSTLTEIADDADYNPVVLSDLKCFKYHSFNSPNGMVQAGGVDLNLKQGKVKEIYRFTKMQWEKIVVNLKVLYEELDAQKFPNIGLLRETHIKFLKISLYGQRVAEVFGKLKKRYLGLEVSDI